MKLTSASVYAVRGLVFLARHPGDHSITAETIAGPEGLSEVFLRKVLAQVGAAGAVRSTRGLHGGYALARPARRITLLDVVEAVEGPLRRDVPRWESGAAGARLDARLQVVCDAAAEAVRVRLRKVTLAQLAAVST
jgi:Rrf2 family protein